MKRFKLNTDSVGWKWPSRSKIWVLCVLVIGFALAGRLLYDLDRPGLPPGMHDAMPKAADSNRAGQGTLPGMDCSLLTTIRDDSTLSRTEERGVWFHIMGLLRDMPEQGVESASCGRVTWLQLDQQSVEYRGDVVSVDGTVRRAHRLSAPEYPGGVEHYYELYLQPEDKPDSPMLIYCLTLPDGFTTGMEIDQPAIVTGVYYKRLAYQSQGKIYTAPTLLAKTIRWFPRVDEGVGADAGRKRNVMPGLSPTLFWMLAIAVAVLLALGTVAMAMLRSRRSPIDLPERIEMPTDLIVSDETTDDSTKE